MRVPISWLSDFVDLKNITPNELAERLTLAGLEVDSVETSGDIDTNVVVAEILKKEQHPGADRLSLCQVTDGSETYGIVCGATNMKKGDKVALAKVGAKLPGDFKIKKSKIRGETSLGMLCSEKELELADEADGILILDTNATLGKPLVEELQCREAILDLEITPNRGDCLSIVGVARELAALGLGKPKIENELSRLQKLFESTTEKKSSEDACGIKLNLLEEDLAPRYAIQRMDIANMQPTPVWITNRLSACGLRPINLLVDITNYILLEWGQPLHAFDAAKIEGSTIVVRKAKAGESITALDEIAYSLDSSDLVICDSENPHCIAGVMGGLESAVNENTKTLLLEAAYFDPKTVRKTSKRLNLSSDSSYRFERGVDPQISLVALARAYDLLKEVADVSVYPANYEWQDMDIGRKIKYRPERYWKIMGSRVDPGKQLEVIQDLGMKVAEDKGGYSVWPPSWRSDLTREIDLIEEVARINGYDQIPTELPNSKPDQRLHDNRDHVKEKVGQFFQASGFFELVSLSFCDADTAERYGFTNAVKLLNPLGEATACLRPTLIPSLLEALENNIKHAPHTRQFRFYEIARTFARNEVEEGFLESERLAGVIWDSQAGHWSQEGNQIPAFFTAKKFIEDIVQVLTKTNANFLEPKSKLNCLHPGIQAEVFLQSGASIGYIGEVHPEFGGFTDLPIVIWDLDMALLRKAYSKRSEKYKGFSRFPGVYRELAVLLDEGKAVGPCISTISDAAGKLAERVEVMDIYRGKQIPEGKKSVAFRVIYKAKDRTLSDKEIDRVFEKTLSALKDEQGAHLRME